MTTPREIEETARQLGVSTTVAREVLRSAGEHEMTTTTGTPAREDQRVCLCPSDCTCHNPDRLTICGCGLHGEANR